jgi:hypothetical protein
VDLVALSTTWRSRLAHELLHTLTEEASDGELAALISFAIAFPDGFMALVDTYDVQRYHLVALPAPAPFAFLAFLSDCRVWTSLRFCVIEPGQKIASFYTLIKKKSHSFSCHPDFECLMLCDLLVALNFHQKLLFYITMVCLVVYT